MYIYIHTYIRTISLYNSIPTGHSNGRISITVAPSAYKTMNGRKRGNNKTNQTQHDEMNDKTFCSLTHSP